MKKIVLSIFVMVLSSFALNASAAENHTCNLNVGGKSVYAVKVENESQCQALIQAKAIELGLVASSPAGVHTCELKFDNKVVDMKVVADDVACKEWTLAKAKENGWVVK